MHIEAATYNNALAQAAKISDEWEQDFAKVEELIQLKKEKGEPYAGMEINLRKAKDRFDFFMRFINAADAYINAMEAEAQRRSQQIVSLQTSSYQQKEQRKTIAEMPLNQDYYFMEIINRLDQLPTELRRMLVIPPIEQQPIRKNSNSEK